jgi:sulfopyruvate decarboxylase TPP-binding subunit
MGRAAGEAMSMMGLAVHRVDRAEDVGETVGAALDAAFRGGQRVAVLLSQKLIGRKQWVTK